MWSATCPTRTTCLPGTTDVAPGDSRGVSYLKDIVFAMQTQDVKASDAILALAQR